MTNSEGSPETRVHDLEARRGGSESKNSGERAGSWRSLILAYPGVFAAVFLAGFIIGIVAGALSFYFGYSAGVREAVEAFNQP